MKIKCFVTPTYTKEHLMYYLESDVAERKLRDDEK